MTEIERLIRARELRAAAASDGLQAAIEALARAAFARMWEMLTNDPTLSPREAVMRAQVEFGGAFSEALAEAFSELLQWSISAGQVRALPVGDIPLSRHLYLHATQTAGEVAALVRQHAQGVMQARDLSRRLYDGYNPRDGVQRPLEGRARAELPKALRSLTENMGARRELTALQVAGQKQAGRLKSAALRAAYLEAFDAWEKGASLEVLRQRLDVAQREKNRFFADRIARTELHRAHQTQVGRDLMADVDTTVVQVRMNPAHPKRDICNFHAEADLWGLGPGNYPKAQAPRPGYHPFCLCKLRSRPSLDASDARPAPMAATAYLRGLTERQAAQVLGSRERAQQALNGADPVALVDAPKAPAYRTIRLGEPAALDHPLMKD